MTMPSDAIDVRVNDSLATIVLNRPTKRNALTRAMVQSLREALRDVYQEKRVRAVVLTGAADAFCSGRDLNELAKSTGVDPAADQKRWGEEASEVRDLIVDMLELPKPLIASVNGPALATGAGLVLACDLVVASASANFGMPDPRFGLVAGIVTPLLAYRLGGGVAARLLLSSEPIDANEACRIGVYQEVVADNLLWARSAELANQCAKGSPEAVGLTKRLLLESAGEGLLTQLTSGAIATAMARTTETAQDGLDAYFEKRPPKW